MRKSKNHVLIVSLKNRKQQLLLTFVGHQPEQVNRNALECERITLTFFYRNWEGKISFYALKVTLLRQIAHLHALRLSVKRVNLVLIKDLKCFLEKTSFSLLPL